MKRIVLALQISLLLILHGCSSPGPQKERVDTKVQAPATSDLSALDANLYNKALATLDADKMKSAAKQLARLQNKNPGHTGIKINLATALYLAGDLDAAAETVKQALSLNANIAALQNIHGLIAFEKKEFKNAETAYLHAIKLDKNLANAHYNLALLYDQYYQDIPKAYRYYQSYIKLNPSDQATTEWVEQLKYSLD
ncbi:MAG: tetratricopeptide repeat protein [Agarilytica sp.]